ncbi:class I tRNA ligase family protein, partial [Candidatus Woesearchaeota archaeon]|nr:class I tRNA ligase family protein [Candidatus Woesearchaeota archaeon]
MVELLKIQEKWQKKWAEAKVFEADAAPGKKKFFLTFPYPYVNGLPHVGHLFTLMRVEAFARYKRLAGYHVSWPQGWHCTGSPIVNAARRIKEGEEKQIKIMKDFGLTDKEIKKFVDPEMWVRYFPKEYKKDLQNLGLSIDWRREFITTSLNQSYDKFIRWQFNKLKEKNYVIKGKFPVVWCPKEG